MSARQSPIRGSPLARAARANYSLDKIDERWKIRDEMFRKSLRDIKEFGNTPILLLNDFLASFHQTIAEVGNMSSDSYSLRMLLKQIKQKADQLKEIE